MTPLRDRDLRRTHGRRRQGGVATLLVVMVLFFVLTMVAGYTSRNIVFEQRISNNLYQATVSLEAAEAGMEWALGMLNGSLIDNQCQPIEDLSTPTPETSRSFRQRYLVFDTATGAITVPAAVRNGPLWPGCVSYPDGTWRCSCPSPLAGGPGLAAPPGSALAPAFRVRFVQIQEPTPVNPALVRIEVNGCTTVDDACLNFSRPANPAACRGALCSTLALTGGLKTLPAAALTVGRDVDFEDAAAMLVNGGSGSSGLTLVAGRDVDGDSNLVRQGLPGMPPTRTVVDNDSNLRSLGSDRMFAAVFGVWPSTFDQQPALVTVNCAGACNSTTVRNAAGLNPGRPLLFRGDLSLDGGTPIGTASSPVLIVVTGDVRFAAPTDIFGLVYSRADDWDSAGSGRIIGAAVAARDLKGNATFTISYDAAVLNALRWTSGSFVRVPGSWADFQ